MFSSFLADFRTPVLLALCALALAGCRLGITGGPVTYVLSDRKLITLVDMPVLYGLPGVIHQMGSCVHSVFQALSLV